LLAEFDNYRADEKALAVQVLGNLFIIRDSGLLAAIFCSVLMNAALVKLDEFECELIEVFLEQMYAGVTFVVGGQTEDLRAVAMQACALVEWGRLLERGDDPIERLAPAFATIT
jgi:hypothetical protein